MELPGVYVLDGHCPLLLEHDPIDLRARDDTQSRAASDLTQEGVDGTAAVSSPRSELKVTGAEGRSDVEVRSERQSQGLSRLDIQLTVLADEAGIRHQQGALAAVQLTAKSLIPLQPPEMRQQRIPGP
jgi:hypothetical protein